jgi:hypothetical protein
VEESPLEGPDTRAQLLGPMGAMGAMGAMGTMGDCLCGVNRNTEWGSSSSQWDPIAITGGGCLVLDLMQLLSSSSSPDVAPSCLA